MKNLILLRSVLLTGVFLPVLLVQCSQPGKQRPQEPEMPVPYHSEEIRFTNSKDSITLAGTLTLPSEGGRFSAVILISGSGPQNRDSEIMGHKPFLIIADYLTRKGIAVLRFDDRGTYQSTGDYPAASALNFATDVSSALTYLKTRAEIDTLKIGLIGHSEGGLVAPIVAKNTDDVRFMVLLAAPGIPGDSLLIRQLELVGKVAGATDEEIRIVKEMNSEAFKIIKTSEDPQTSHNELVRRLNEKLKDKPIPKFITDRFPNMTREEIITASLQNMTTPAYRFFLNSDPSFVLKSIRCPVLALNGEKDLQVPAEENLSAIKAALEKGGNKAVTIKVLANLNHLFQECQTGSLEEYERIEQTISPVALAEMSSWILSQ